MKASCVLRARMGALLMLLAPLPVAPARAEEPPASPATTPYRIGAEDVLRVRVARHEDLGGEVVVLQDGRVVLPVVGALSVSGLTVEQVRELVTQGLRKKLVSPEVAVEVVRPRPQRIFVSGLVKASQPLDLKEGWRVTEALANAGGLAVRPEVARGTLFRAGEQTIILNLAAIYVDQDPAANLKLQPGDVIDIQEHPTVRIYVGGMVNRQGLVDLNRGRGVMEALTMAGGAMPDRAALSKSYVLKADGRKIPIDLFRIVNRGETPPADLKLEAGDQLIVPENLNKIAVYGMVRDGNVFPMRDGEEMTVGDAISLARGFEKRAQKSHVGIIRMVDGKQTVIPVDMTRLEKGKLPNIPLQDRDIIFVPETRTPDWAGKVLPGLQALTGAWWYLGRK
jgi:polysaccharide export outer membrane protein